METYSKNHYFEEALNICSYVVNVNPDDVKGPSRLGLLILCRMLFVLVILREYPRYMNTESSLNKIGDFLGGRDHSTMVHTKKMALKKIASVKGFESLYDDVVAILNNESLYKEAIEKLKQRAGGNKYQYFKMKPMDRHLLKNSLLQIPNIEPKNNANKDLTLEIKNSSRKIDIMTLELNKLIAHKKALITQLVMQ